MTEIKTSGNIYGYARVSTVQQDLGLQFDALTKAGVPKENIYSEKMSGKEAKNRVEWNRLKDLLVAGDTVFVHKLDRLGRSMVDVMSIVEFMKAKGIFLVVLDAGIDTRKDGEDGLAGLMTKALMTILSLMAEMERTFIIERTKPAIEQAKKKGVKFGRPVANKKLYDMAIKEFLKGDITVPQLIKDFGKDDKGKDLITQATFWRRLKAYQESEGITE